MADLRDTGSRLERARADHEEARLDLQRKRERLAQLDLVEAGLTRRFDPENAEHQEQKRALDDEATQLRAGVAESEDRCSRAAATVVESLDAFVPFSDPRTGVAELDVSVPTLLFPVRIETRFKEVEGDGGPRNQLWVRVYPDDCLIDTFEPTMSEAELLRVREFWVAWAKAGKITEQERGAWRVLAGHFGSGRAAWLIDQHRPANLDTLPAKAHEAVVNLVVVAADQPQAADQPPLSAYWRAAWLAGEDQAARDAAFADFAAAVTRPHATELVARYAPANFAAEPYDPEAQVEVVYVELPDPSTVPTQRVAWSRPAQVTALPERLVLLGYRGAAEVLNVVGAPIPTPLAVGPDPLADAQDQLRHDRSELEFGDDLRWLADFDEAVRVGMGFRVDLDGDDLRLGFDQLMVLGVRLSADAQGGKQLVESQFLRHQQSATGFGLLPTGAATNNTESAPSAYGAAEDPDATFDLVFGKLPPLTRTDDYLERLDGQWLADTLGLDLATFERTTNSRGRDMCEARAMNTVLWPATWGYFMESMMRPVFDGETIEFARWYFSNFVTGRGLAPAVRIGDQPYGILPATAFSRMRWPGEDDWFPPSGLLHPEGFRTHLARLPSLLGAMRQDWERMSSRVAQVGRPGDPHQTLLDIVGLTPASVEYYRRWAESLEQLSNRHKLAGFGGLLLAALIAMGYTQSGMTLLGRLGYDGTVPPELLEKFFLDAARPITGDLVDDRPLSETEPIRAWTPEGDNYIGWLVSAAETSFERLRTEEGFIDGTPPRALLYLLLRYALEQGYWDASIRVLDDAGALSATEVLDARIDPSFVHVTDRPGSEVLERRSLETTSLVTSGKPIDFDRRSESRYEFLYRGAPGERDGIVADLITAEMGNAPGTGFLAQQLAALRHLEGSPTARLERVMAEHLDLASYRLDAWRWGLLNYQLASIREGRRSEEGTRSGVYVGAFGWLENVHREERRLEPARLAPDLDADFNADGEPPAMRDSANQGFIHGPSLDHAIAAAILRNGYVSNAGQGGADVLAVDLSSTRVRTALDVIDGLRNGQSLGALLGYRLERGLHDRHAVAEVDRFIYGLRKAFPLVADRLKDTQAPPGEPIQSVEARNVVDGLALVTHIRDSGNAGYPFGKTGLADASPAQAAAIDAEVRRLEDVHDAIADLATSEAVYQAVRGNYERTAATLDAFGNGSHPPYPEVIQTPRSGISLTHRVGLQLEAGRDGTISPTTVSVTPRTRAEPALNAWLATVLPPPTQVGCLVDLVAPARAPQTVTVTQHNLGLQPLDLLYVAGDDFEQAMGALDDRIEEHVIRTAGLSPDVAIAVRYRDSSQGTFSFFEVGALVRSVRSVVLRSRPLGPTDTALDDDARVEDEQLVYVDPVRVQAPLDELRLVTTGGAADDLTKLGAEMAPLIADTDANGPAIAARAEAWSERYLALARAAAEFGIPQAGIGPVIDGRRRAYVAVLDLLDEVLTRWEQRLTDYAAAVAAAQGLPTDQHFAALRVAERLVTTTFTDVEPATPAHYVTLLDARRDAYAAKRSDLAAVRQAPATTTAGVVGAIAAELPVAEFDAAGIDLSGVERLLVSLAVEVDSLAKALSNEVADRATTAQAKLDGAAANANAAAATRLRVEAAETLFGDDFVLIPEYTLPQARADELGNAWADRHRLLRHLTDGAPTGLGIDFPLDDWLYGLARVREKLGLWEHMMVTADALGTAGPELTALQLPYRLDDHWLGLQFPEGYDHGGDRLTYTAHFAVPFDKTAPQCGLLIDEWTEVIPGAEETTGVVFHYDRPNTEPPQVLLLALSPRMSGGWEWQDLVDAVRETFAEARLRAVEPSQIDDEAYARFLPAAIMAATRYPVTIGLNLAMNSASLEVSSG